MQTIVYSQARDDLAAVMDKAVSDDGPVLIKRKRGRNVVMVSARVWSGMEETMYLLSSPKNAERLLEAVRGFEAGDADGVSFS